MMSGHWINRDIGEMTGRKVFLNMVEYEIFLFEFEDVEWGAR